MSELRARLDWHLCPDANPEQFDFVDTSQADRPILAAAISSEAKFIITSDVDDFGNTDLRRYGISAVNPGLFLAARVTPDIYTDTLYEIAARRQREPRTATSIHNLEIAVELDVLFRRFQTIFGPTTSPSPHNPPRTLFKGAVCIQCKQTLTKAENGLHQDCRWQDWVGK
ncbi:MAG: hypothetical protein LBE83_09765 [Propionibacteriaceae bacterium]|nr:hypothetical protein [Propionibacteriaceae bacterium]